MNSATGHPVPIAAEREAGERGAARALGMVFGLALVVRVGWVVVRYAHAGGDTLQFPDEEAYLLVARSLASGVGLVDEFGYRATYMPGYPAFLALFAGAARPVLWARLVQAVLAACVAPATYLLANTWAAPRSGAQRARGTALIAGLWAALDPFLLFFSGLLLTEALTAVAIVWAWYFVVRACAARASLGNALGAGLFLFAALMLRPSSMVLVIGAAAGVLMCRRFSARGAAMALVLVAVTGSGLLPWAARNRAVLGEWRWLTTRGGISLYDGLQPGATGASDLAHTKTMPEVQGLGEPEWDALFHARAVQAMRDDPGRVLRLGFAKLRRTWSLTPNADNYRGGSVALIAAAWTTAMLGCAVAGLCAWRRAPLQLLLLLLPVLLTTLLHMVYVGSVRYRLPVMPMIMVLAAAGAWQMLQFTLGQRPTQRTEELT